MFTSLSECYCVVNKIDKAIKVVNKALEYLKDTKYEGEIKLADAKISVYKNDIKNALKILNAIKSDQDTFIKVCFFFKFILKYIFDIYKQYNELNCYYFLGPKNESRYLYEYKSRSI